MKKKINAIAKSQRERKRYLKIKIEAKNTGLVKKLIYDEIQTLYGLTGFAKIGFGFVKDTNDIIKINRDYTDQFMSALNYINLKNKDIKIEVEKISGTIKGFND